MLSPEPSFVDFVVMERKLLSEFCFSWLLNLALNSFIFRKEHYMHVVLRKKINKKNDDDDDDELFLWYG